ncbi:MAG TPA: UDP-N-acetylmuramoyl-L-alanine--D-glutamate ligase [Bryobacteraceae bacterium]|nr:UDP-N-acetylmuramoyl-L-alanine--D-glutamate ligase [Bryobacteraceae bacterium]
MKATDFSGARIVVVGMVRSGQALVQLLARTGARVTATDVKPLEELPGAARILESAGAGFVRQSPEAFRDADWIVVSPGVPADLDLLEEARGHGVRVIGEVELAGYFLQGKIIGITGSNGKTTTTALTGHILRECGIPVQVGGNIGSAVAGMVDTSRPDQWNVLELSSFQLETTERFRAHIAVALNVTPDHLDRHHTFENYAAAKGRLFRTQQPDDFAVLNADDPVCSGYAGGTAGRTHWFSLKHPVEPGLWMAGGWLYAEGEPFLEATGIPLRGSHNVENVLAAATAARLAGAQMSAIAGAVRTFPGVEHRLEFVRTWRGIDFYNDSKATNVDATLKAIDAFAGPLWVILGGKDKGSDYRPLGGPLSAKAKAVLLVGAATPIIAEHLHGAVPLAECGTIATAVSRAAAKASAGDTVLLAPACASFDQFENFEHRGRVFKELVQQL